MAHKSLLSPTLPGSLDNIRTEYDAARESRFRRRRFGVTGTPHSADYHTRNDSKYFKMVELARDMDRNDPMLGQALTRCVDNTIQDGPTLDPDTGDKGLDEQVKDEFWAWACDPDLCDLAGEMTFHQMGRLAFRQMLVDGDIFALPNTSGSIQMLECHRARTPKNTKRNVVNGVLLNENRRHEEYWFTKESVDPMGIVQKVGDIVAIPTRDDSGYRQVMHVYNPTRVSQTRGVTALAPIVDLQSILGDSVFATLVKLQVSACWAVLRERQGGTQALFGPRPQAGPQTTETISDGTARLIEGISPGMDIPGLPGEKLTAFTPQVVANETLSFIEMLLTWIGTNIGMPLVMMTLDSRQTNFSGWRGSFEQAKMGFRANQQVMARRFYTPIYQWKVRHWIAEGGEIGQRLRRVGARAFEHNWGMPSWPYIEPVKDAAADLLIIRNGLNSPRRVQHDRGRDLSEVQQETVEDNANAMKLAIQMAQKLSKETGEDINWRELLCLPAPDGVSIKIGEPDPAPATAPAGGKK